MSAPRIRIDMHLHTSHSFDCLSRPEEVVRAARERGLDRVIITDHNEITGALAARELDPERVVVGEEVKTREGFDIIGIFIESRIPARTPARETCERIREQGGVVYLPHPFDGTRAPGTRGLSELLDLIDVVEVHNARCWPGSLNRRALDWAVEHDKLMGAGSDAHTLREVGRGVVELPPFDEERESLLRALGQGVVSVRVHSSPAVRIASNWAKVRRLLPGSPNPGRRS